MSKSAAPLPLAFPAPDSFSLPRQRPLRLAANCRSSIPSQGPWNKILTFLVKVVLIAPMKFMPFVSLLYWLIKYLKNRGNLRYALLTSNFGQILQRLLLIVRGVGAGEEVANVDSMIDWGAIRELPDVAEDEEVLGDGWSGGGGEISSNYAGGGGNKKVVFLHRVQRSLSSAGDGYVDFLNVLGSFIEDSIFRLPGFVRNRLSVTTLKQLQSAFNAYTMLEVVFLFYQKYQLYKMNKAKVYQPQVPIEESLVQLEQELEAVDDLQLGHLLLQGQKLELESKKEARENLLEQKAKLQKLVAKVESRFLQLLPNSGQGGGGGDEKPAETTSPRGGGAGAGEGGALTVKQQPAQSTSSDRDSDDSDGRASVDAGDDSPSQNAVNNGGGLLTAVSPKGIHDAASSLVATGLASVASMSSFAVMTSAALHQRKLRLGGGVSGAKLVATSPAPSSSGKLTSSRPRLRRQSTARTIESALREGVGSNPAFESTDGDQSLILPPTPAASLARIVITDDEETSCGDAGEGASSGHTNGSLQPLLQPHRRLNSLVLASADAEGLSERAIEPMEVLRPLLFQGWFRYKKNVTRNSDLRSFRRKLYDVEKYPRENLYNFFRHLYNFLFKMKMTWCPSLRTAIYNWTLGLLPPDGDEEIVDLYDIGRENLREWLAWGFLNVEYHYVPHLQNGGGTTNGYNGIAPSSLANTPRGGGGEDNNYKNYNYHLEPPPSAAAASQSVTNVSMSRFTRDHLMMTSTMISRIEQWMGHKFRPGYNEELVSMRLTMDPVQAETRSVLAYLLTQFLIPTVGHNIIVHLFGFAEGVSGTMSYYFRKPSSSATASGSSSAGEQREDVEGENNNKASTSTDPAGPPLVFCHGLGMGPFVYVQFIYELIKTYPDRDIFVIFVPQISCRISDANIASAREMVSCIADMLAHHYSEFNLWDTFERRRYLHDDLELSESESEEEEFLSDPEQDGAMMKDAFREEGAAPGRSRKLSSTSANMPARRTSTERNVQRLESVRMDRLRSRFHRPSIFVDPLDRNPNPETAAEAHVLHQGQKHDYSPAGARAPPRPSSAGAAPPSFTPGSKKRRFPHGAHFIGHSFGTFVMSWVIRRRPDLVAYATFVDPVCFRLFSPDLAYNMVYREPPTWIQAGIQYGVARELHVAQSLRRRLFWQQWILWPEKLKFPTNVVLSGLDSMIPAHSIRTHLVAINELRRLKREELLAKRSRAAGAGRRGKEVLDVSGEEGEPRLGEQSLFSLAEKRKLARISVLWFPHLGHGEFLARPKAKPALEEIIARVGRIERENPYD
mmetsp:Transcript_3169/g.7425  ORF Transcript_3169/g.7425 Transcript_3169/m.7425 type:complete len:1296 (-) Transcript_3169:261-4148(-)